MSTTQTMPSSSQSFKEKHGNQYHVCSIEVGKRERLFDEFRPTRPGVDEKGRHIVIIGFDGYTLGDRNGLPWVNRVNETCEKYGLYAVYPRSRKRFGINNVFNVPNGMARYHPRQQNDIDFIVALKKDLQRRLGDIYVVVVGFSAGAQLGHLLAAVGLVDAVVSVSGTWIIGQPYPKERVRAVIFHGEADFILPWHSGIGGDWRRKLLGLLLLTRTARRNSIPSRQVQAYNQGSRIKRSSSSSQTTEVYTRSASPEAVVYIINGGGHTWNGRLPVESEFSGGHGAPLSADVFNTNERWVQELSLDQLRRT